MTHLAEVATQKSHNRCKRENKRMHAQEKKCMRIQQEWLRMISNVDVEIKTRKKLKNAEFVRRGNTNIKDFTSPRK
jgi:hypothetical protein